ncbi:MAG: helix-turn-helix transcriptional regulator [Cellulomonadaceae bacterium]|nr:helix-turn-helix transcriptional regulator [Cellulomonadaceae bacterium]
MGTDEVFRALGDVTRRAILDELVDRDGQSLFELCSRLTMKHAMTSSRQAVSQHIDVLVAAGLVTVERRGRYRLHHLDPRPLEGLTRRWTSRPTREPDPSDQPTRHDQPDPSAPPTRPDPDPVA